MGRGEAGSARAEDGGARVSEGESVEKSGGEKVESVQSILLAARRIPPDSESASGGSREFRPFRNVSREGAPGKRRERRGGAGEAGQESRRFA